MKVIIIDTKDNNPPMQLDIEDYFKMVNEELEDLKILLVEDL